MRRVYKIRHHKFETSFLTAGLKFYVGIRYNNNVTEERDKVCNWALGACDEAFEATDYDLWPLVHIYVHGCVRATKFINELRDPVCDAMVLNNWQPPPDIPVS